MNRRILPFAAAAAALALAVSGCSSPSETGTPSEQAADGLTLQEVKDSGVLTVGTEGTYKPFSYHAGGTGDLTGYDVEVVTAVADKLGVKPEFKETQWDAIFAGLEAGRFDVIANQVTINDARKKAYDFSTPYTISRGVIVTTADNTDISSFADLKGKTTAQSLTSNWNDLAKESGATVQGVEGWAQSITLLKQGRVDATINDKLTYLDYQKSTPDSGIKVAAETKETSEAALAFPQGSEDLVKAVDQALADLSADGTLAKISDKYFGEDVSQ
ncbi:MAG TPA: amino acid ABC transporter substrate-binding protein [Arthrobacter sp.]|nr:amino acid ABC transporter substrate-binding protein [Arthrobacter sp.]